MVRECLKTYRTMYHKHAPKALKGGALSTGLRQN